MEHDELLKVLDDLRREVALHRANYLTLANDYAGTAAKLLRVLESATKPPEKPAPNYWQLTLSMNPKLWGQVEYAAGREKLSMPEYIMAVLEGTITRA